MGSADVFDEALDFFGSDVRRWRHADEEALVLRRDGRNRFAVGWVSRLSLREFLSIAPIDARTRITIGLISADSSRVDEERIRKPALLTDGDIESIHLVGLTRRNTSLVWERVSELHSDVAVVAKSWRAAWSQLSRFVPPAESRTIADELAELAVAS